MKKTTSLMLLVGAAMLSWTMLSAGEEAAVGAMCDSSAANKVSKIGTISATRKDVDIAVGGHIYNEYDFASRLETLHADNADQLVGVKTKACLDVAATCGTRKFGKSAADAFLRLTSYAYWKQENYYVPFPGNAYDDPATSEAKTINWLTYAEEAWVDVHFGTFFDTFKNWCSLDKHPISLKMGMFPYQLGRGLSLGDFEGQHVTNQGFEGYEYQYARNNHAGALIHGYITDLITYDLYFSKQESHSLSRRFEWVPIHSNRTDGHNDWRGVASDRNLWAARVDFEQDKKWGKMHVQPYLMYVDCPETHIEVQGDSNTRLGTVGMMCEFKKARVKVNAEVAAQFGHQNVYPIDRNLATLEVDSDGVSKSTYSHVFADGSRSEHGGIATSAVAAVVDNVANRGGRDTTTHQWIPAVTKNGDPLVGASGYFNSDVTGNARFRDGYRIDYRGFMGVLDIKYTFEKTPASVAAAVAYLSGDNDPYNTEKNKRCKQFIPYGDYNYTGKYVESLLMLWARKLPRPTNFDMKKQYAQNNTYDTGNLAYFGLNATWHPLKKKSRLKLQSNLLFFWEATTLKKWDRENRLPGHWTYLNEVPVYISDFAGDHSWQTCPTHQGVWTGSASACAAGDHSHHIGWMSDEDASRMLGTEINFEAKWKMVKNCKLVAKAACFIPGALYKDLEGQPNSRMANSPLSHDGIYGLGHDVIWGFAGAIIYKF